MKNHETICPNDQKIRIHQVNKHVAYLQKESPNGEWPDFDCVVLVRKLPQHVQCADCLSGCTFTYGKRAPHLA